MDGNPSFPVSFDDPIVIESVDAEGIESVARLELDYPTLNQCSSAFSKYGGKDEFRLQLGIYVEAITKANGIDVDRKWKNRFGMEIFKRLELEKLRSIGEDANRYGLDTDVDRVCQKCGKEWRTPVSTSNFFASALRSI